jgi:hypothetical protein
MTMPCQLEDHGFAAVEGHAGTVVWLQGCESRLTA